MTKGKEEGRDHEWQRAGKDTALTHFACGPNCPVLPGMAAVMAIRMFDCALQKLPTLRWCTLGPPWQRNRSQDVAAAGWSVCTLQDAAAGLAHQRAPAIHLLLHALHVGRPVAGATFPQRSPLASIPSHCFQSSPSWAGGGGPPAGGAMTGAPGAPAAREMAAPWPDGADGAGRVASSPELRAAEVSVASDISRLSTR